MFERLTMGRAVIIGFMVTALYYFLIYDSGEAQLMAIQGVQAEIARIQGEIQAVDQKLRRAEEYKRATQNLGSSIEKLLSYIPANFRIGQLMKTVSEEARVAGLDITRLAPKTVEEANKIEDFTELGVSLQLEGQYDQVLSFMSNLTKKRQIFIFEKLEMISSAAAPTTTAPSGLVKVTADIHAFSYRGNTQ